MKIKKITVSVAVFLFLVSAEILWGSGDVPAPRWEKGDWWQIKVEVAHSGISRSGLCEELYSDYLVKVGESGSPEVYGGEKKEIVDCSAVISQLLDQGDKRGFLKFPLRVGQSWSFQYLRTSPGGKSRWVTAEHKVSGQEQVMIGGEKIETLKIERSIEGENTETYWYSPRAKANVLFRRSTARVNRTATVTGFGKSPPP